MRSRQSRIAVGSPPRASSTARRVNASDSPARNAAAASVALLREPVRRPSGLRDRPFLYGRPRARPGGFGESPLAIVVSSIPISGPFGSRPGPGVCNEKKAILRMTKSQKRGRPRRTGVLARNRFLTDHRHFPAQNRPNRATPDEMTHRRSTRATYRTKPRALYVAFLP
jgi:hypothetical protein